MIYGKHQHYHWFINGLVKHTHGRNGIYKLYHLIRVKDSCIYKIRCSQFISQAAKNIFRKKRVSGGDWKGCF